MDEIDVQAVERIEEAADEPPARVDAAEYVLYGGKGGVGKTTMAAATGLASARRGVETLVVSTDPAHSLSDTFGTHVPAEPTRIREDVPLYAVEIDPEAALSETPLFDEEGGLSDGLGGLGGIGEALGDDDLADPMLGGAMPGADEAAAMQQLLRFMDDPRYERVVVDTAPTGHTLRLLELPELMDSMVGKLLTLRQRLQGLFDGVSGMFGGGDGNGAEDGTDDLGDLDELRERIERLRSVLRDPSRTDFRIVMVPEEMSVLESRRLLARLEEFGIPVGTVVVNRVMEDLASVVGDAALEAADAEWFVAPDLEDCEFCQRRWKVQQSALSSAQELFRGHDVRRVPLLADEVRGEPMLRLVGACLG